MKPLTLVRGNFVIGILLPTVAEANIQGSLYNPKALKRWHNHEITACSLLHNVLLIIAHILCLNVILSVNLKFIRYIQVLQSSFLVKIIELNLSGCSSLGSMDHRYIIASTNYIWKVHMRSLGVSILTFLQAVMDESYLI